MYAPFFVCEEARPIDHDKHIVAVERVACRITKLQQGTACFTYTIFRIEIPDCVSVRRPFSLF